MKSICFLVFMISMNFTSSHARAGEPWIQKGAEFTSWLQALKTSPQHLDPLAEYFPTLQNQTLTDYSQLALDSYKKMLTSGVQKIQAATAKSSQCKEFFNSRFDKLTSSKDPAIRKFESEGLVIESLQCLPSGSVKNAEALFLSDDFALAANSTLTDSHMNTSTGRQCQKTDAFPIGKSNYCVQYQALENENSTLIFSFNDFNQKSIDAPVYLRLVSSYFQNFPDGSLAFYTLTMARGPSLPFHSFVLNRLASENEKYKAKFQEELAKLKD